MIKGYITRGTTVHGRSVNEGEIHEMDADTFQKLRLTGDVVIAPEPEPAPVPVKVEAKQSKKKD